MELIRKISKSFIGALMALSFVALGFSSCDDDDTTDSRGFALYYSSLTDVSPTMNGVIARPTFKGSAPSNFSITSVAFGEMNESYTGDSFQIDAETGEITILNTDNLHIGEYKISISCMSAGKMFYFQDAVVVNFMKAVPEGITVEPNEVRVDYDVVTGDSKDELPTAQVTTDGNHITITGYQIASIKKGDQLVENFPNPFFTISKDGEISIVKNKDFTTGKYVLSLKLNTAAAGKDSELGLFPDAVSVNVVSKPRMLTYSPDEDLLEEESEGFATEYKGEKPAYEGSLEGLNFSIASVEPASGKDKFTINEATGEISVLSGHNFKNGDSYQVSVLVKNEFCTEGVLFSNAFKLKVVEFIAPIQNFNYAETTVKQALKFNIAKDPAFKGGGNLKFSFSESDQKKFKDILTLNEETGEISAPKYNSLVVGTYPIHVIATNNKGSETAVFTLNVIENENFFTYVSYGNNIHNDESVGSVYDNQYRFHKKSEMNNKVLEPKTDIKSSAGMKWKLDIKNLMSGTSINKETGAITLTESGWKDNQIGYAFVTATKGEGEEQISRTFPVFIHCSVAKEGVTVEYTPFVLHVNPQFGGRSVVPTINKKEGFLMDYRRSFSYQNINGIREDGSKLESGAINNNQFLKNLWTNVGKTSNFGAKLPVSYYDHTGKVRKSNELLANETLAYVDNDPTANQFSVVVNPMAWYDKGWADGVFMGQMTFVTNNEPVKLGGSGNQIFPLAIWFDKDLSK